MAGDTERARWPGAWALRFIEAWFILLGFITVTAVVEAAALVSEVDILHRLVEFSYLAMMFWVLIKVNHFASSNFKTLNH